MRIEPQTPVIPVFPPVRVLEDAFGTARAPHVSPVEVEIVLVRDDLWTIGTTLDLAHDARDLYPSDWIAFALREDLDGQGRFRLRTMRSFDRLVSALRERDRLKSQGG